GQTLLQLLNAHGHEQSFTLPLVPSDPGGWIELINTTRAAQQPRPVSGERLAAGAFSLVLLQRQPQG
ncbi:MAG: hypothetical protein ACREMN_06385, partial [Gemmatimonadales bacterium]